MGHYAIIGYPYVALLEELQSRSTEARIIEVKEETIPSAQRIQDEIELMAKAANASPPALPPSVVELEKVRNPLKPERERLHKQRMKALYRLR